MIDQMHIMYPRGACAHTGQTGQAAVDMFYGFLIWHTVVFKHVLDQINAPARTV